MIRTLARYTMLVLALTLSINVFAGSKSQNVTLLNDAQLNGKTLHAGDYTVTCNTKGTTAEVKFLRNGKEVATANGQVKQVSSPPTYNQVITQGTSGTPSIAEIDFANSKTGVTFDSGTMASEKGE